MSKIVDSASVSATWSSQWIIQTDQAATVPAELYQCPKGHQQDEKAIAGFSGAKACEQCCKEWLAQMFPTTQIAPCPECGSGFLNRLGARQHVSHNEGCTIDAIERAAAEP